MELKTDIVVIGGGWAGLAAALEAQSHGREVLLLQKAPGATALSSGALDVADFFFRTSQDPLGDGLSLEKNIEALLRREENHPYSLLVRRMGFTAFLDSLRRKVRKLISIFPLTYVGDLELNQWHLSNLGNLKMTSMVQASMADGNLAAMNQAKVLVVGIRGFAPFSSRFLKESLLEFQSTQVYPYLQFVGNLDLEIPGLEGKASLTAMEIANRLDREEVFVPFGQSIFNYIKGKVYTHLLLPPVMGVINNEPILMALRKITGLKAAETLATPLSIPGYRWENAARHLLKVKEIETIVGAAVGFDAEHNMVKTIRVHAGSHRLKIEAKAFVLATGKFIGGGVIQYGDLREALFHLPLFEANREVGEKEVGDLTRDPVHLPQPLFSLGIKTNELFQPLGRQGEVVFQNLFAAGSILSGYDPIRDGTGAGVAVLTGSLAAQNACEGF